MQQEKLLNLDKDLEKDIKDCKETAELIEKVLNMIVKGFVPEY